MILVVANQKGGVTKTTTTLTLAHLMHLEGDQVTVLDLDAPGEEKLAGSKAAYRRATALGIDAYLLDTLPDNLSGHLLVDCPPDVGNKAFKQAVALADLVIVPTSTSMDDLEVSLAFADGLTVPYRLLFTRIHPNASTASTSEALRARGYKVLDNAVTLYSVYGDAPAYGGTVSAMNTVASRRATKDYLAVLHEVKRVVARG